MKFLYLLTFNLLLQASSQLNRNSKKFLTDADFKRAAKLTAREIDSGEGAKRPDVQFNSNLYGGDIVDRLPTFKKDVHGYISRQSGRHWKDGIIPYEFVHEFTDNEKRHIARAISLLMNQTCIKFVNRKPSDRNYIKFVKKSGCYSQELGRNPNGAQEVSLGDGCVKVDIIIHELMHAIGFMHEFSRPDRDQYIYINLNNIEDYAKPQFRKLDGQYFGDWKLPFDIESAMFYEANAGAKNARQPSMRSKSGAKLRCKPHLCPTKLDIDKINTVYGCHQLVVKAKQEDKRLRNNNKMLKNCRSLEWKSSKRTIAERDNAVVGRQELGETRYVCRAKINGLVVTGMTTKSGCLCLLTSGRQWTFGDYDVLINGERLTLSWSRDSAAPRNAVTAGRDPFGWSFVTRCATAKSANACSDLQYLTC